MFIEVENSRINRNTAGGKQAQDRRKMFVSYV